MFMTCFCSIASTGLFQILKTEFLKITLSHVQATDGDEAGTPNSDVTYSIIPSEFSEHFSIEKLSNGAGKVRNDQIWNFQFCKIQQCLTRYWFDLVFSRDIPSPKSIEKGVVISECVDRMKKEKVIESLTTNAIFYSSGFLKAQRSRSNH